MYEQLHTELGPKLSRGASITNEPLTRWSAYEAPEPIVVVEVNSEEDVVAMNLPFLARNGGNGWAKFSETQNLVMISLAKLNTVTVASNKNTATIGGGVKVHEAIAAADEAGVIIMTGNCNGIGVLGASLGGGYGNTMGMYGFGIDNILEMRVVTADRELRPVSATKEPDLFWALRGAGPNFGIVVSAIVKAYVMPKEERSAWTGAPIFSPDKHEQVVQAIQDLEHSSHMVTFLYLAGSGPPSHAPVVVVTVWQFQGTPETGKIAFKALYNIGPKADTTTMTPYTRWNTGGDPFCVHSGRKPAVVAGVDKLYSKAWREVWEQFVEFQQKPGAQFSAILLEVYPINEVRFKDEGFAAFAHRTTRFQCIVLPWYEDASLDGDAVAFGQNVRELLLISGGGKKHSPYVNICSGNEPLEEIYGDSLPRFQQLKKVWDPKNRFNQWYNIKRAHQDSRWSELRRVKQRFKIYRWCFDERDATLMSFACWQPKFRRIP